MTPLPRVGSGAVKPAAAVDLQPGHAPPRPAVRWPVSRVPGSRLPRLGVPRGMAAAARQHWLAAALLTAGLVLRVLTQLAYRPALFYIDSERYLYNAQGMDPVGYKGPLLAVASVGGFGAVAVVQHLLGLGIATALYLLLLRRGVSRWLAALAIAPVLLDGYQVQNEQTVMPGTWFEALIVAGLVILLWRPVPGWRRVLAAGVVLGGSATLAQVGEALILPGVIYLVAVGGGWRAAAGRAAAFAGAFIAPILVYCTVSYLVAGQFFLSHTGVTSFYGRAAAAVDCSTLTLTPAERGMCPDPAQQAKGPDWLEYQDGSPIRPYYNNLPRADVDSMLSDFNHRALTQQPLRLAGAYGRDLLKLFALTRAGSPGDTPISRWQFQTYYPYYPPHAAPQVVHAAVDRYGGGTPAVWRPVAAFLRAYQLDGGYTPGPLFALCAVAGAAGSVAALRRRRRADPRTRQLVLACLLCFTSGAAVLLVSDLFEFSWRYQLPALVTLVPAGALGLAAALRLIKRPRAVG